jgi:thioredoxin-like negative regulator of GroEL
MNIPLLVLAVTTLGLAGTPASPGQSIEWRTGFESARAAARATNTPMLLEFYAGWCAPCKYMDTNVYSNPQVVSAMKRVVPVRVDMDSNGLLARQYSVETIPTLVFTDSHGTELFRHAGLLEVASMVQLLGELPADVTRINQLSAAVAANKDDGGSMEALGQELRAASFYRASNQYFDRALKTRDAREQVDKRASILAAMGWNHLELKEFTDAEKAFSRCLGESGGKAREPEAMLGLGRALLGQGRQGDARRLLQSLSSRFPATDAARHANVLLGGK